MIVKNKTKKAIVAENTRVCDGPFSKSKGLMFSLKPKPLLFVFHWEQVVPLHMFFVFFPIDVIFLDKDKKVVELKENFKPFSWYTPKKKAMYIVEVPKGTIKASKSTVGDSFSF